MNKYLFLDTETTGTTPDHHEIWQIGALAFAEGNPNSGKTIDIKIRPLKPQNASLEALEACDVLLEDICKYQHPVLGLDKFISFLKLFVDQYNKLDKFFIIAYKASFDKDMLRSFFFANGNKWFGSFFNYYVIDLYGIAQSLYACGKITPENLRLGTLVKFLNPDFEFKAHDALGDVKATKYIYDVMRSWFPFLPELLKAGDHV